MNTQPAKPIDVDNIVATIPGPDTTVAVIRDPERRCLDIVCSRHGLFYVCGFARGATVLDIQNGHDDTLDAARAHADNCVNPRALDRS